MPRVIRSRLVAIATVLLLLVGHLPAVAAQDSTVFPPSPLPDGINLNFDGEGVLTEALPDDAHLIIERIELDENGLLPVEPGPQVIVITAGSVETTDDLGLVATLGEGGEFVYFTADGADLELRAPRRASVLRARIASDTAYSGKLLGFAQATPGVVEISGDACSPETIAVASGGELTVSNNSNSSQPFTIDELEVSLRLQPHQRRTIDLSDAADGEYTASCGASTPGNEPLSKITIQIGGSPNSGDEATATATTEPTATKTPTPAPTATSTPRVTATSTATKTSTPEPTTTPIASATSTPRSTATPTPAVTATSEPTETATPSASAEILSDLPISGAPDAPLTFFFASVALPGSTSLGEMTFEGPTAIYAYTKDLQIARPGTLSATLPAESGVMLPAGTMAEISNPGTDATAVMFAGFAEGRALGDSNERIPRDSNSDNGDNSTNDDRPPFRDQREQDQPDDEDSTPTPGANDDSGSSSLESFVPDEPDIEEAGFFTTGPDTVDSVEDSLFGSADTASADAWEEGIVSVYVATGANDAGAVVSIDRFSSSSAAGDAFSTLQLGAFFVGSPVSLDDVENADDFFAAIIDDVSGLGEVPADFDQALFSGARYGNVVVTTILYGSSDADLETPCRELWSLIDATQN